MATLYWKGLAPAVAQVSTIQITAYDAATTYKVTVGGVTISTIAAGSVNATATALQSALATSTHPYFTAITWTVSTDTITGTANIAGVPFIAASSKTGGTGTILGATTTVSSGPNDWSTAANWSTGSIPANGDTVIFSNSSVNVCWGLAQSAVALAELRQDMSYTGRIGLDYTTFATTSDGTSNTATVQEYRTVYLQIGTVLLNLGLPNISGTAQGSGRMMFDLGTSTGCTATIYNTAASSADSYRPAIRLKGTSVSHFVNVRSAPGGVGICNEIPGETGQFYAVTITDQSATSKVFSGFGASLNTWEQYGGNSILQSTGNVPTINVQGGTLTTEGAGAVTTILEVYGGTLNHNMTGNVSHVIVDGGFLNALGSATSRAWSDVKIYPGNSKIAFDPAIMSMSVQAGQVLTISA